MNRGHLFLVPGFAVASVFLFACTSQDTKTNCQQDSDCQTYERCEPLDQRCVCTQDEACAIGEVCNASGSCQIKAACFSNQDCPLTGDFCDVQTGECSLKEHCSNDFQCPLDQICQNNLCQIGCRDNSDCEFFKHELCQNGSCVAGECADSEQCGFGMVCILESQSCELPPDSHHCQKGCDPLCTGCQDLTKGPCGDPANICTEKKQEDGQTTDYTFCAVACIDDRDCPSGFDCVPTVAPWIASCETTNDCIRDQHFDDLVVNLCGEFSKRCRLNKQPCQSDNDCFAFDTQCVDIDSGSAVLNQCVFAHHCMPVGDCL